MGNSCVCDKSSATAVEQTGAETEHAEPKKEEEQVVPPGSEKPVSEKPVSEKPVSERPKFDSEKGEFGDGPQAKRFVDLWEASGQPSVEAETVRGNIKRRPSSENIGLDDYSAKHSQLFQKVLALEKPEGWLFKKELEKTMIYTKEMPGQKLLYFKGVCDMKIPGGIPALMVRLLRTEDRPKWDELCSLGKTPSYYPPFYKYTLVHIDPPAPMIAKREMLAIGRFRFEQDGALVISIHSIEDPAYPEQDGNVRINFIEGGYVLRPKPGEDSTFTVSYVGLVDPAGWLPTWLANIICVKQGGNLSKMKEFILKEIAEAK